MATFHLQIVTPDRIAYDGEAQKLLVRTASGDVCILAHHIDYAVPMGIGVAKITNEDGTVRAAACSGGMLSVYNGEVRVMSTTFEWSDEIDLDRAQKAQEQTEEKLRSMRRGDQDYWMAEAKLKRAITRISAKHF